MKWVTVNNAHFNLDLIEAFYWSGGKLCVHWHGEPEQPDIYDDPNCFNYSRLCIAAGVVPIKEEANGKS